MKTAAIVTLIVAAIAVAGCRTNHGVNDYFQWKIERDHA